MVRGGNNIKKMVSAKPRKKYVVLCDRIFHFLLIVFPYHEYYENSVLVEHLSSGYKYY